MSVKKQSRELLSSTNASITNPRLIVIELLLQQEKPLTIEQILKLSKGKIAQSTLYRVINDLTQFGLIVEFTGPDNTIVVELKTNSTEHHHHIFCEDCGEIVDIELDTQLESEIEKEIRKLEAKFSLSIHDHSLELYGTCTSCSKNR